LEALVKNLALALTLALSLAPSQTSHADGGTSSSLVGTWELVSVDNLLADGRRIQPYGAHPVGRLTLDDGGRYSVLIFRPGRPRFASNDKSRGTAEENQALVTGTNSHFGRYALDAERATLIFRIDHASFPNWEETEQARAYVVEGDLLRYTVRTTTTGGTEVGEVTWRRASSPR
jgi:hypothetical protein